MGKKRFRKIEQTRIIMARKMDIPPDDIDMSPIFTCVQRSVEERVENNLDEYVLIPANEREIQAIVGKIGNTIIPMLFNGQLPFGNVIEDYDKWYEKNLSKGILNIRDMLEEEDK